ncbi:hypothetical protein KQI42_02070 [Tissierella sp. MSJ-40]|jgi:hypothetical protein|uniref:Uncharacterized protein n=1 Tax=Tissierella simiarum TaxID=2841534 RepID=A0ABS6E1V1_9FIRM|nr:hypothetical protein [Tissierella simiarum]MBU5436774.1 hypothetical protein [Tissierella simiarum]
MTFVNAIKKISKRKKEKNYYNSDYILNAKEKQSLLVATFIILFPIIITAVLVLAN